MVADKNTAISHPALQFESPKLGPRFTLVKEDTYFGFWNNMKLKHLVYNTGPNFW